LEQEREERERDEHKPEDEKRPKVRLQHVEGVGGPNRPSAVARDTEVSE
jgi:hypothetical protein